MKKKIFYPLYALTGMILFASFLIGSGIIHARVSPYYHYKFNENEAQIFDKALYRLRERVENGKFDEIENDLADGLVGKATIIAGIKKARKEFGKSVSSDFFRSSLPESAGKFYKNLDGKFYTTYYFTKTESGEFFENISWVVNDDNEAQILNYGGTKIIEWQSQARARESYANAVYSNEIKIPFGYRFIEIKY